MTEAIDLSAYGTTYGDMLRLKDDLRNAAGDQLWSTRDQRKMRFIYLQRIKQTTGVENTEESIRNAAQKVLAHFGLKSKKPMEKNGDPVFDYFDYYVIGFATPPKRNYEYLTTKVRWHLQEITDTISNYEREEKYIKAFLATGQKPSSPTERLVHDFYLRCIKEQRKILRYYLYGTRDRALQKSQEQIYWASGFNTDFFGYRDFPYQVGKPNCDEYFIYQNINHVIHRIRFYPIDEIDAMETLYKSDKSLFYKQYFQISPLPEIMQDILFRVNRIPPIRDRKEIFEELMKLFQSKQWVAFYGLGLSQIEGLFTDMMESIDKKKQYRSLTEKVNFVRKHARYDSGSYDYFAYIIPDPRNTFMHTGHDTNLELKSYDLITDLLYLLREFEELENPLVKLFNLKQGEIQFFYSYENMAEYFALQFELAKKNPAQQATFKEQFDSFHQTLITDCDIPVIIYEVVSIFDGLANNLHRGFINYFGLEKTDGKTRKKELAGLGVKTSEELVHEVRIFLMDNRQEVDKIKSIHALYNGLVEYLKIEGPEMDEFARIYETHKDFIKLIIKIDQISSELESEEVEEF